MTLEQFAESLKQELKKNYSQQAISLISEKINKATINGRSLTLDEKEKIFDIITHTYIGGENFFVILIILRGLTQLQYFALKSLGQRKSKGNILWKLQR